MKFRNSFLLVSILISLSVYSQKIIIKGEETNRKLNWSDFTGKVDKSTSYYAYTMYKIIPKTENIKFFGDSVSIGKFEIAVELDPQKTWAKMDKVTDELLVHEQGHFNIGILCMREIHSLYRQSKFTKANFSSLLQSIITNTINKYSSMTLRYDDETKHSANKEQQAKWNSFFAEMLSK